MYLSKSLILKINFIIILSFFVLTIVKADLIKPNNGIEPYQVVKIQLRSLMNNDEPYQDIGIEQTWEFAHPNNQKYTGPLEKFKIMLKGEAYSMLLNHSDHEVLQVFLSEDIATFDVTVLDTEKNQSIIVCCYHGNSSQRAAQFLTDRGFKNVYSLNGGYEQWKSKENK